ncbi:MAG: hydroxyacylglutathione hydrolase [Nitrosomonadales bacterium]|jgi:hydroxyacylglutathione hydrolase|nr:hydroxyacylglutathione hydrolase [Nitrosomonadales bacterium]MBT4183614.1 hydroxyacylglutathione hydrolase [Nitrosomonadales bacterium]MBT4571312.1 hydroxyacylglutathione hydrolase [Nitrosomonadales bacterium]MBT4759501.1 hydroxyacylglutathione hydrolase [Nitrosomonadales bacterium]MBT5150612.1 hydroxyacylglutathione hydrolase [Nitrosomonadales bacterium]
MIKKNRDVVIVDPGDSSPVLSLLKKEGFNLKGILITHKHADHIGGIEDLIKFYPDVKIYGPKNEFNFTYDLVSNNDLITINELGISFRVIETPGHTLDHIVFADKNHLFCGDTLFGCGCGKLFEGTFSQMHTSLKLLSKLPGSIKIFCAHEYTKKNIEFALTEEKNNKDLISRKKRLTGVDITLPSTLYDELKTNPFLRSKNLTQFKERRIRKDNF